MLVLDLELISADSEQASGAMLFQVDQADLMTKQIMFLLESQQGEVAWKLNYWSLEETAWPQASKPFLGQP